MIEVTISGAAHRLLLEGSPGDAIQDVARAAVRTRCGRGYRATLTMPRDVANDVADYLWEIAGCVGGMTTEERDGGSEHVAASVAVTKIEEALLR